jgi:hypothetical protein
MMDAITFLALVFGGLLYTLIGYIRNYIQAGDPFDFERLLTGLPTVIVAFFFTIIPLVPTLTFVSVWAAFAFGFMGKWATDMTVSIYKASRV